MQAKISESEYEVMEVVWRLGSATVTQMQNELSARGWAYNTIATFASRLLEKGYLSAENVGKAKVYTPSISCEEYKSELTKDFLNDIHCGSKRSMLAALFDRSLSDEILDRLISELEEVN